MKKIIFWAAMCCFWLAQESAFAQVRMLNKIKQKVEDKADQAIDKALSGDKSSTSNTNAGNASGSAGASSSGRARNNSGEGLISTPPDVNQNLQDAEGAYKAGTYNEARYAVQQAILGVELQIGQQILKSLPETVSGLKKDEQAEQVSSVGWGWSGLTILRRYTDGEDKELSVVVANNAVLLSAVNLYLTNGGYAQTTGGEQNWKQTKVKGHRAVIEYDESTGYKLTVPLGQSSLIMYEGVNFKNEQELMAAANTVDIDGIKKMLGEQ